MELLTKQRIREEIKIKEAIRIRKIFGGGMRQAGYLAAAGSYALLHHRKDLINDHRRAKEISECLNGLNFIKKVQPVETNIIIFSLNKNNFQNQNLKCNAL